MFVLKAGIAPCEGVQSYATMRDAREAAQAKRPVRQEYRCRRCAWWHLEGYEIRDRRHKIRVVG